MSFARDIHGDGVATSDVGTLHGRRRPPIAAAAAAAQTPSASGRAVAEYFDEFATKVLVQPTVEERIDAGRAEDENVADREGQSVDALVQRLRQIEVEVGHDVQDVQRHPTEGEH